MPRRPQPRRKRARLPQGDRSIHHARHTAKRGAPGPGSERAPRLVLPSDLQGRRFGPPAAEERSKQLPALREAWRPTIADPDPPGAAGSESKREPPVPPPSRPGRRVEPGGGKGPRRSVRERRLGRRRGRRGTLPRPAPPTSPRPPPRAGQVLTWAPSKAAGRAGGESEVRRREAKRTGRCCLDSLLFSHSQLCRAARRPARFIGGRGRPRRPDWFPEAPSPGGSADAPSRHRGHWASRRAGAAGWGRADPGKKERERAVGEGTWGRGARQGEPAAGGGPGACREGPHRAGCRAPARLAPGGPRVLAPPGAPRSDILREGSFPRSHCTAQRKFQPTGTSFCLSLLEYPHSLARPSGPACEGVRGCAGCSSPGLPGAWAGLGRGGADRGLPEVGRKEPLGLPPRRVWGCDLKSSISRSWCTRCVLSRCVERIPAGGDPEPASATPEATLHPLWTQVPSSANQIKWFKRGPLEPRNRFEILCANYFPRRAADRGLRSWHLPL